MSRSRVKTGQPAVDRSLEDLYRRLERLERTQSGGTTVVNNTSVVSPSQPESVVFTATSAGNTTSASRRWMVFSPTTWATTITTSGVWTVPQGISRITGLTIAIVSGGGGGPATVSLTYRVTLGTATTEYDTSVIVTVPGGFVGGATGTGSFPCTPGQIIRIACDKSAAMATQQGGNGISALVIMEA